MKKRLILAALAISCIAVLCSCSTNNQESTLSTIQTQDRIQSITTVPPTETIITQIPDTTVEDTTGTYVLETEQINYHDLTNDEFAEKVATDFSTEKIKFSSDKYDDEIYFLKTTDTKAIDDIMVSCSDYGNNLTLTFSKDASGDDAYDILAKGLKSDLFGLSFEDQVDILAQFKVGSINYIGHSTMVPIKISEKDNDLSRLIFIAFTN